MKLGSLFDGSGTFPLAARMMGIEPVWASEVEAYPIKVTTKNFPNMKHLGSILDINGAEIEPVEIITGGSPCQDLSVAGRRDGIIEGKRSSLFFEQIRVIREMREHDKSIGRTDVNVRPRFCIWENVPGARNSGKPKGADFREVLQAFVNLCEEGCTVPLPAKWETDGVLEGNGWSIAWTELDAQDWVPQRRKRVYLVADLGGNRAAELLLERKGLHGNYQPSGAAWEGFTDYVT